MWPDWYVTVNLRAIGIHSLSRIKLLPVPILSMRPLIWLGCQKQNYMVDAVVILQCCSVKYQQM